MTTTPTPPLVPPRPASSRSSRPGRPGRPGRSPGHDTANWAAAAELFCRDQLDRRTHPLARAEARIAAFTAAITGTGLTAGTAIALAQAPAHWPWALLVGGATAAVSARVTYALKYRAVQAGARDRADLTTGDGPSR